MKYSEINVPLSCIQTNSTCYKQTREMKPIGILWHSTGSNNPNLKRYIQPLETDDNYQDTIHLLGKNISGNDWNHIDIQAGVNAWIGKLADGTVTTVQTMPWNFRPWGCGKGSNGTCNDGWIQFEICEGSLKDAEYFKKVYKEACELTAYLCQLYNIDPYGSVIVGKNGISVPTILCHSDSYRLGMGSNHGDVYHWFKLHGKTMLDVRNDVAKILEDDEVTQEQFNIFMDNYLSELNKRPATFEGDALAWAVDEELLRGDEAGNLMPKRFLTRGEFAVILKRFVDNNNK